MFQSEIERYRGGQSVGGGAKRKMLPSGVKHGNDQRKQGSAGREKWVVNHGQAQDPKGMLTQKGSVGNHEQQARSGESREESDNAEIPDLIGIEAESTRGVECDCERNQDAKRGKRAVGGDDEGSDVEENWMHSEERIKVPSADRTWKMISLRGLNAKIILLEGLGTTKVVPFQHCAIYLAGSLEQKSDPLGRG